VIRAVIFDMDGLLLDTEPLYRAAWERASAEFGYRLTHELYSRLAGRNRADAERMLAAEFGPQFPMEQFKTIVRTHEEEEFSKGPIPTKPGVNELLGVLDARQIPRAVATSSEKARAEKWLSGAGILTRFGALATGDQVARGKPAPDIFLLAAKRLAVQSSDCLVLEDAEPGVRAARAARMSVYVVPDVIPPSREGAKLATKIFRSLCEVAEDLERELPLAETAR
jgi:HAD superfamily hydrolase (TIGR01509 family)